MATITKTTTKRTLLAASTSITAGNTQALTEINLSTAFGGMLVVRVTNGATGPTTDTTIKIYVGTATGEKYLHAQFSAGQDNNGVYDFTIPIPEGVAFLGGDIIAGATNNITAQAFLSEVTSYSST